MVAVSVGLSACSVPDWANPVEWYRDTTGISEDDPKPDARNTQNLEKGGEQPYPNLASVPPPPNNALSSADREKLRNSLAADRANAKYVEGNDQYVAAPPKVVPSPPLNAPEPAAQPQASAAPAAQATPVPAAPPQAAPPAESTQATPAPAPAKPPPSASPAPARGTEKPPQESSLTPPSVRSVPQGETPRPPPPPPAGVPVSAQTRSPPAPQPPPPQTAALPPPSLPPTTGGGVALPSGVGGTLGTVTFAGNSAKLSPEVLEQVREVAALRQRNGGGTIRVTGYSEPQGKQDTVAPQLASFNLALDRARAVAAALTQNGVPVRSVEIGASPPPPGQAGGVVEMALEQ